MSTSSSVFDRLKQYHFELKHLLVLFLVLIFFMMLVSFIHKASLNALLIKTQEWYQRDSAERLANLIATSLELLLENAVPVNEPDDVNRQKVVQAFNIIFSQQMLRQNVDAVSILVLRKGKLYVIDDGNVLFDYFFNHKFAMPENTARHREARELYVAGLQKDLRTHEQIYSIPREQSIHVFVPFVPKGEFVGAVYVKNTPDFSFITHEIIASYDETALIFAALIILGLLAMFYISSYTVKERDETQELLFREREGFLLERVDREKEALFTKRIYHTHHKAEKVMGFIKEDLRSLDRDNIEKTKARIIRYANFISRVIYDMKWYDPPVQTIRNPAFRTDINEVLEFIVQAIFLRTANQVNYHFDLELCDCFPPVPINEFVIWEIFEPLIQNCVEHGGDDGLLRVRITTRYNSSAGVSQVWIRDNGRGLDPELLRENKQGTKALFVENVSTKNGQINSGYGCYIAYEIARHRCGWSVDAANLPEGGCCYTITIPHQ